MNVAVVADITSLKAVDTTVYGATILTAAARSGQFIWTVGDFTARIAADTLNGVYVKANAVNASSGAWVRQFDLVNYRSGWFGAVADYSTDNTATINTIITTADSINTLTAAGQQAAACIYIEGGVKFNSVNLNFLSSGPHIYVYLRYFANSDVNKGVPNGDLGTNELMEMSVNSGYPGDASGGMTAEWRYNAPLHPAIVLNVAKSVPGADAHFGTGQVRIPTTTGPARASYNILDDNVLRMRWVYESYAGGANAVANEVSLQPFNEEVQVNNVGSIGWPAIPANGTTITGVISGAKGIKIGHSALGLFMSWVSGQFQPGEQVTDGVTTSTNQIGGGGVSHISSTLPSLMFGYNTPVMSYGEFPGYPVTGAAIHSRLTIGRTNSVVAQILKETVTNAGILFTNTSNAVPTTGRQTVLDNRNRIVIVNGVANGTGSTGNGLVGGLAAAVNFTDAGGVSSNAFNVASVTKSGTGLYLVVFTNPLANADYSISFGKQGALDNPTYDSKSTTGFRVVNTTFANAIQNLNFGIDVSVHNGQ
jgi:hypothetical protein